jgi:integrase
LAKKPTIKIGIVLVTEIGPRTWKLRYRDPATGKDIRRRLSDLEEKEVLRIAANVSCNALAERGYLPGKRPSTLSVHDALAESIRLSKQRPYIRKDSTRRAALFEKWLKENFRGVKTWDQVQPGMVQAYVNSLEERGLAYDTVKNHLKPVKAAWRHMAENYPDQVRPLPTIKIQKRKVKAIQCLNPGEVSELLAWLRVKSPALWPVATLQALVGLRMLEATSLRRQDIDFQRGTIEVTETDHHAPKTLSSHRVIPVCEEVLETLREHIEGMKVLPATGELFLNRKGNAWTAMGISLKFRRALSKAAKRLRLSRLGEIPPHRLRASFATMAARLDVPDRLVKRYLGHSATDVLGNHYQVVEDSEMREVSSQMGTWRKLITRANFGNNLATSGDEIQEVSEKLMVRAVR